MIQPMHGWLLTCALLIALTGCGTTTGDSTAWRRKPIYRPLRAGVTPLLREKPRTFTEPIPQAHVKETAVGLKFESRSTDAQIVNVRLINPTERPVTFAGYSEQSPWYKIEKWVDGAWVDHRVGWFCGTGLRVCVIPPGHSSVIPVRVEDGLFPVRIGVGYSNSGTREDEVVWSTRIDAAPSDRPRGRDGR